MESSMKKGNNKYSLIVKISSVFLVVLILCVVGLSCLKIFVNKNRFKVLIENTFQYLESSLDEAASGSSTGTFSFGMKLQSGNVSDMAALDLINKLSFSGSYGVDYDKKLFYLDLDSDYDNKELIDANIYLQNGSSYIYLENLYDKYIQVPIENYDSFFEGIKDQKDYVVILNSIEKALLDSLKDEYFENEKVTLRSQKVDKTTFKLNNDNYMEIKKSIIQSLLEDEKYLTSFAKISNLEVIDVKDSLNESLEEQNSINNIDIVLYTKGAQFVQFELMAANEKIVVYVDEDKYIYEVSEDNSLVISGSVMIQKNGNNNTVKVQFSELESKTGIEFVINSSVQENAKVDSINVDNQVSYENLTESDINEIGLKLLEKEGIVTIIQEFYNLSNQFTSQYSNSGGFITG